MIRPISRARSRPAKRRLPAIVVGLTIGAASVVVLGPSPEPAAAHGVSPPHLDGGNGECSSWKLRFLDLGFTEVDFEIAEEGWVWVDPAQKLKSASGVVTKSKVAHNDTPANHFSHDWNVDFRVDPGQEFLLSDANGKEGGSSLPSKIEMEWETGITPSETSGDGSNPWFPRWVFPNVGDRVWTDGHWVFDCGHGSAVSTPIPEEGNPDSCPEGASADLSLTRCIDSHFRTEIHPGRAIASMRSQAATLPGSGTTPVPVTATDLYIHGNGAFMVQQLECGIGTILAEITHSCPNKTTAIDDDYGFDICLPPKPAPQAALAWSVQNGPGNTLSQVPSIQAVEAVGGCDKGPDEFSNDFDNSTMLHVQVPLEGSGATPTDVYARRIVAGWVFPPSQPLRHLQLRLDQMDLHNDHEAPGFNGELSFLWMNVDRSPIDEWHRLVNFDIPTADNSSFACGDDHINRLEDYDDDDLCGNGLLDFSGPTFDFYLRPNQPFTVRTTGYEQDCYDSHFGSGHFSILDYVSCHGGDPFEIEDWGNNDKLADISVRFPPTVGAGRYEPSAEVEVLPGVFGREFELEFEISDVSLGDEDTADLDVQKFCTQSGEVALAGQPFTCTVTVKNNGPGLPRDVTLTDTLTSPSGASYSLGTPQATVGTAAVDVPCSLGGTGTFNCAIGTIPVGQTATVAVEVVPASPGSFTNSVVVTSLSSDPTSSNNGAQDSVAVHQPIAVDVQPGNVLGTIYVARPGLVTVAVITTPAFNAATIDPLTLCFGDSGTPTQRDCTEAHLEGHLVDVDRDRDLDLVLHYESGQTGIDIGDIAACLKGRTMDSIGVFGCDSIRAR